MTVGISSGGGLIHGASLLVACELEGNTRALATELLEVPVVPGSEVLLVTEGSEPGESPVLVVWGEPAFTGADGEVSVLDLAWEPLATLPGEVLAFRSSAERELLLGGRPCDAALLMTAAAGLRVRVPPAVERLVVECGFDAADMRASLARVRCCVYRATPA